MDHGRGAKETEHGRGVKETVLIVGVLAVAMGGVVGTYWMDVKKDRVAAAEIAKPRATAPAPTAPEALHDDIYFDFKSVRLRADGVRLLQQKAALLRTDGHWVVLVQGYTDGQGPAEYNRVLAQRRAEAVKHFLVEEGVPEATIKVASVGADGALCGEPTKECQQLNRRVHLEMRHLGASSAATTAPVTTEGAQAR